MNRYKIKSQYYRIHNLIGFILLALLLNILSSREVSSQTLFGYTGLVTIPTAEIAQDREIILGLHYINKEYFIYHYKCIDAFLPYITIGYLPFIEINLRMNCLNQLPDIKKTIIGDRTVNIRLKFLSEGKYYPSVAIGGNDILTTNSSRPTNFQNCIYIVASKSFTKIIGKSILGMHLGYGSDMMKAAQHQFIGVFGGCSVNTIHYGKYFIEYDTNKTNFGFSQKIIRHINIVVSILELKSINGGLGFSFHL